MIEQGSKGDAGVFKPLGQIFFSRSTDLLEGCSASPQRWSGWAMLSLRMISGKHPFEQPARVREGGAGAGCEAGGHWGPAGFCGL